MRKIIGLSALLISVLAGCDTTPDGGAGGGGSSATHAECFEAKPGCVVPTDTKRISDPDVSADDQTSLSTNNTSFALDLGRQLHDSAGNVVYSPYSVSTALAMTYAGARTTTETAIAKAMHFELPQERLHPAFNYVDLELHKRADSDPNTKGGGFRLHTANALYSQVGLQVEKPFVNTLVEDYGAYLRLANFQAPKEAEGIINQWVSDQTEGKITKLLDGNVTLETLLVLVNAIYFDAAWGTPFQKDSTKPGSFKAGGGSSVTADMMHGTQETSYASDPAWEAVEIPYAGTPVSMLIVMPTDGTADTFEQSFDATAFQGIESAMMPKSVDLTMPKFSFRTAKSLMEPLKGLGMGVAFTETADFSGILSGGGIQIQDVIHQAVIDVDEEGTEAAAATTVVFAVSGTGSFPDPVTMTIDHPFYFFIHDLPTGAILFAGRVNDPTAH